MASSRDLKSQLSNVDETTRRFRSSAPEREVVKQQIDRGLSPAEIERQDRVERRIEHLGVPRARAASLAANFKAAPGHSEAVAVARPRTPGLERIIGEDDLLSSAFLERGAAAARSVCCIRHRGVRIGTGFLVTPRLLLTNAHVLPTSADAYEASAEFDFEDALEGTGVERSVEFSLAPDQLFVASPEDDLDYALVAVSTNSGNRSLSEFGYIELVPTVGKVLRGESLNIIQHPNGAPKRVALRQNRFTALLEKYLHYESDTAPGSSGAPVFNDQWDVVCIHHKGVPLTDTHGRILTRDNRLWDIDNDDPVLIQWIGNEGVRVSRIVADVGRRLPARPEILEGFPVPASNPSNVTEQLLRTDSTPTHGPSHSGVMDPGTVRPPAPMDASSVVGLPDTPHAVPIPIRITLTLDGSTGQFSLSTSPSTQAPAQPVSAPRLTLDQWQALVRDEATTEAQIAPYFMLDEVRSQAFDPVFRLNPDRVVDPVGLESDRALTWANRWCRDRRRRTYRDRLASGRPMTRLVAEGDSWFQYPFLLHDIIDHLIDHPDYAVFSLDAAGDLLSGMMATGEYQRAIAVEQPRVFLISGGGNDLVGDGRLATMLHRYSPERPAEAFLNAQFDQFIHEIEAHYRRLFTSVLQTAPTLRILCHAYDYVIPGQGEWLGQPMRRLGIVDPALQRAIMRRVIDRMNSMLADVARDFPPVRFLDLRGVVPASEWYDELHPTNAGFTRVARVFENALRL